MGLGEGGGLVEQPGHLGGRPAERGAGQRLQAQRLRHPPPLAGAVGLGQRSGEHRRRLAAVKDAVDAENRFCHGFAIASAPTGS